MPEASHLAIVVTRPQAQASSLCFQLKKAGFKVIQFPVIEITPAADIQGIKRQLSCLDHYDLAIFISANAVNAALALREGSWPQNLPVAAIGQATAKALEQQGIIASLVAPKPYNSEALLSQAELQTLDGKRMLILRGVGGREYLAETLRQRGAEVEYAEVYQRKVPDKKPLCLSKAWREKNQLVFVVTSNEGLQNLYDMVGDAERQNLLSSILVVASNRTATLARELGFKSSALVADSASDDAILTVIQTWSAREPQS